MADSQDKMLFERLPDCGVEFVDIARWVECDGRLGQPDLEFVIFGEVFYELVVLIVGDIAKDKRAQGAPEAFAVKLPKRHCRTRAVHPKITQSHLVYENEWTEIVGEGTGRINIGSLNILRTPRKGASETDAKEREVNRI